METRNLKLGAGQTTRFCPSKTCTHCYIRTCLSSSHRASESQAYPVHAAIVSNVGNLEAMMVPADYTKKLEANIPGDFDSLPRLLGRASVSKGWEREAYVPHIGCVQRLGEGKG